MSQACTMWHDDIGAYILGALDPDESTWVRQHLRTCAACRADYHDLLPVRDWLALLAPGWGASCGPLARWGSQRR
jgi:anti-sigma factor RsiW